MSICFSLSSAPNKLWLKKAEERVVGGEQLGGRRGTTFAFLQFGGLNFNCIQTNPPHFVFPPSFWRGVEF